ncbi:hypothetical protein OG824_31805 [Streptomyces prunicolor]|uniref:hypothetical protein n=1 Tax=Streptomyces prunicolor TaxID=67348 RepID=UPI002251C893|nr:hypothetical protein [Streptomyces prunicolor]MCX5239796.1 hypothetical protein [Streptomyces prunicolor]
MARERRRREKLTFLPGIADIRIGADEATTRIVVEALAAAFNTTAPSGADSGYTYLRLDAGCTDPDD